MKKTGIRILCLLAALCLLGAAGAENAGNTAGEENDLNRVFYEIFVGSFSDSDGDGTGDLRGIINRLDYLNDGDPESGKSLGIQGLWLTPVFESPSYHKYDVSDYYAVDSAFGSAEDLKELIDKCHERDVLVILDLALNHTSTRNRWYQNFLNSHIMHNPGNPQYNWYVWIDREETPPAGRSFITAENAGIQVEANFSHSMPELDFDQEAVRQAALDVAKYYLDLGADGFRLDAAKYIYFGDHEKNIAFWNWYAGELKKIKPDVYLVAEVWDGEGITNRYISCMNCFHFATSQAEGLIAETAGGGDVNRFTAATQRYLEEIHAIRPDAMNIPFLANHDMDRAAGYLTMASGRAYMAANLYLLTPGSPFLYYGEEIGLRGSRGGANTDANRRLAMLWGDGDSVQDPAGSTYTKQTPYSVKDLEEMGGSLLKHYRKVIRVRRQYPEIARGEYTALKFDGTMAGGFLCTLGDSTAGVFHNTTEKEQVLDLTSTAASGLSQVAAVLPADPLEGGAELKDGMLTLGPQTSAVLK